MWQHDDLNTFAGLNDPTSSLPRSRSCNAYCSVARDETEALAGCALRLNGAANE